MPPVIPNKSPKPGTNAPPPTSTQSATTMDTLQARLEQLAEQAQVLQNTVDSENRSMTDGEAAEMERINAEFASTEREIRARATANEMSERLRQPSERRARPAEVDGDEEGEDVEASRRHRIEVGDRVGVRKGGWGFRSMGEFGIAVANTKRGKADMRIVNAPSTYGQEAVAADGGFAVPPDFRDTIMKQLEGEDSLMSRCDVQTSKSNTLTLPQDTTTPWQTSGGVLGGWSEEGDTITASKPKLGALECKLKKLTALVPLTDELLEDVPAMTGWLESKVPEKFTSLINTAIVSGNGVGKPLGLLSSPCKVTVAAVGGQGAGTFVAKNATDMWARLYAPMRRNAAWLINQDVEPQIQLMVMPGTTPAFPVYLPPGGFSGAPYATLFGRPIIPIEACSALGTEGDVILTDLTQYLVAKKAQGMRTDTSIHLYFDSDHVAFRFIMRLGGQSYWPAPIVRQNGSNTLSPIVTLNSSRT
jgi:HK97 family phage major capsid protein